MRHSNEMMRLWNEAQLDGWDGETGEDDGGDTVVCEGCQKTLALSEANSADDNGTYVCDACHQGEQDRLAQLVAEIDHEAYLERLAEDRQAQQDMLLDTLERGGHQNGDDYPW